MSSAPEPPILSLAARPSPLVGLGAYFEAAQLAGLRLLDLAPPVLPGAIRADSVARSVRETGVSVRALWLPPVPTVRFAPDRIQATAHLAGELVAATGAWAVIVERPHGSGVRRARQARLLRACRQLVPSSARLALALRPDELTGTREHLDELAALRRTAEEWDLDLALDLDGRIDPTWEAEGAVSKLFPRLTAVRVGSLESKSPDLGRERQSARVLAFLADLGYRGAIALVPRSPIWRPDRAAGLARSWLTTAQTAAARFDAVRGEPRHSRVGGLELPG
jgi:hypothetical protein